MLWVMRTFKLWILEENTERKRGLRELQIQMRRVSKRKLMNQKERKMIKPFRVEKMIFTSWLVLFVFVLAGEHDKMKTMVRLGSAPWRLEKASTKGSVDKILIGEFSYWDKKTWQCYWEFLLMKTSVISI